MDDEDGMFDYAWNKGSTIQKQPPTKAGNVMVSKP